MPDRVDGVANVGGLGLFGSSGGVGGVNGVGAVGVGSVGIGGARGIICGAGGAPGDLTLSLSGGDFSPAFLAAFLAALSIGGGSLAPKKSAGNSGIPFFSTALHWIVPIRAT